MLLWGGGSSAFDRRKFLELGGFDTLLKPFYLEDTDLGYHGLEAWLEGAISAEERRISRASRNHRKEVLASLYRVHPEEEFRSLLLEEYSRMAETTAAILARHGQTP